MCIIDSAIRWLDKNLFGRGLEAGAVTLYFLPLGEPTCPTPDNVRFVFLEKESLPPFYLPQWSNALCEERKSLDVFAVAALCGGLTAGLAGASCDCSDMLQIGVDVLPAFRGRGLGAALTSRLAACIRAAGKTAFYCCEAGNLPSIKTALRSGFRPTATRLSAQKQKPDAF